MAREPNILILMPDQQRADCLSSAGHPQIKTPNMDRIAREGMRFAQATTVSPICMPARISFIKGLYPHNYGIWANYGELAPTDETLFHILQRAGYATAYIGKSHYYPHAERWFPMPDAHMSMREDYMHALGLEHVYETTDLNNFDKVGSFVRDRLERLGLWETFKQDIRERREVGGAMAALNLMVRPSPLPVEEYVDSCIGRKAVEFVQAYEDTRPLCLFVGFVGPHEPWDAPGEYATMYDPDETPSAIPIPEGYESFPDYVREKKDFEVIPPAGIETIPEIRANYYGKISLIDTWFGHILDAFQSRGWLDDLLVVHWADHGEMAGDHGRLDKSTFHEASLRVPLVLRWPGRIPANTTTSALVENIDVSPTLLEAVGSEPSVRCLGRSLWPVMRDPQAEVRDYQLSEIYASKEFGERRMMIRSHRHKYAIDEAGRGFMLYDLQEDPEEQHNLIGREGTASLERDLREVLLKRLVASQYSLRPP